MNAWRRNAVTAVALFLAALLPRCVRAADIQVNPPGPVFNLPVLTWGNTTGTGLGFNNNFFFAPLAVNESVCVFVKNNNTTNPHNFAVIIAVTANSAAITPSDGTWNTTLSSSSLTAATAPGISASFGASISGVSQVSINFSGSVTAGGSPDTAQVTITQTPGNCPLTSFSTSGSELVAAQPVQIISNGATNAYFTSNGTAGLVNPAAGSVILAIQEASTSSRNVFMVRLTISSSVAATFSFAAVNAGGVGCAAAPIIGNFRSGNNGATVVTSAQGCTSMSTFGPPFVFIVPANTPTTIDLSGFYVPTGGNSLGFAIFSPAAITGTVIGNLFWYEK